MYKRANTECQICEGSSKVTKEGYLQMKKILFATSEAVPFIKTGGLGAM